MTLPDERYRSILQTERLLKDLLVASRSPRVPKAIRERAAGCLRHFPSKYDLDSAAETSPHIFQERLEPLYKMIKQHEMGESVREELDPRNNK